MQSLAVHLSAHRGCVFVIGAVGPEAQKDKAGFERAVSAVKARLAEVEP